MHLFTYNLSIDKSGSCAIVVLIVGDRVYTANVGDSRALLATSGSTHPAALPTVHALSTDHKPGDEQERKRIIENGGQIYQSTTVTCSAL